MRELCTIEGLNFKRFKKYKIPKRQSLVCICLINRRFWAYSAIANPQNSWHYHASPIANPQNLYEPVCVRRKLCCLFAKFLSPQK